MPIFSTTINQYRTANSLTALRGLRPMWLHIGLESERGIHALTIPFIEGSVGFEGILM